MRGVHDFDRGTKPFPELRERIDRCGRGRVARRDDAPAMAEQFGETGIGSTVLGPCDRVRGDDHCLGQRPGQCLADAAFGGADIADDGAGYKVGGNRFGRRIHRADGYAQDHQLGLAHGVADGFANGAGQPAFGSAAAHGGIGIPAGGRHTGQHLADCQPDRTADQAQPDDCDARNRHAPAPHSVRNTRVMSSIWRAVPMVMRSACGSPCPGRWRTA